MVHLTKWLLVIGAAVLLLSDVTVAMEETPTKLRKYLEERNPQRPTSNKRSVSAPSTRKDAEVLLDMYSRYPRFTSSEKNDQPRTAPPFILKVDGPQNAEAVKPKKTINFSRPRAPLDNAPSSVESSADNNGSVTEYIIREYT